MRVAWERDASVVDLLRLVCDPATACPHTELFQQPMNALDSVLCLEVSVATLSGNSA